MARVRDNVRDKGNKSCIWKAANSECSWNLRICEGQIGRKFLERPPKRHAGVQPGVESKTTHQNWYHERDAVRYGGAVRHVT